MSRNRDAQWRLVDGLAIGLILGMAATMTTKAALVAAVLLAVRLVARRKSGQTSGWGLFGFTAAIAVVLVVAVGPFGSRLHATMWLLSLAAAQALWVEHHFTDYSPPRPALSGGVRARVMAGILWGGGIGLIITGIAAIPLGLAEVSGEGVGGRAALLVLLAYPLLGVVVGGAAGASLRLALHPAGLLALGALGGAVVYGAFGLLLGVIEQTPISMLQELGMAFTLGLLVGPPVAFNYLTGEGAVPVSFFA